MINKPFISVLQLGQLIKQLFTWLLLIASIAFLVGTSVAFFLWSLDKVTTFRWHYSWLLFLLPFAGIGIVFLYKKLGRRSEKGNNLLIEEIHQTTNAVPIGMAPLILVTTLLTHLFGGSAGREGTAVQMGGSIAAQISKWFFLKPPMQKLVLLMGMSAGFGAVFGTPIAATIFALEVLAIGRIKYDALLPCLFTAIAADITCAAWGIEHTKYIVNNYYAIAEGVFSQKHLWLLLKIIPTAIAFGLTAWLFSNSISLLKKQLKNYVNNPYLVVFIGGTIIIVLSYALNSFDYLGLGVTNSAGGASILQSFTPNGVTNFSWLWKLIFTVITLAVGFKGGEVTPLFFIGAALGNVLANVVGVPTDLLAAIGFVAVFAGATNTPLASTIMAVELFGTNNLVYFAVGCFIAYYFSGHKGIYTAQKIDTHKHILK